MVGVLSMKGGKALPNPWMQPIVGQSVRVAVGQVGQERPGSGHANILNCNRNH